MENEKPISAPAPANADSYGFQKIVAIIGGIVAVIGALTGLFSVLPPFTSQTIATIDYFQEKIFPGQPNPINPPIPSPPPSNSGSGSIAASKQISQNLTGPPSAGCTEIISSDMSIYPPKITRNWDCPKEKER